MQYHNFPKVQYLSRPTQKKLKNKKIETGGKNDTHGDDKLMF